jgi:hypothetical protein
MKIALKAANNKYVCAELGLPKETPLRANREAVGAWETFELEILEQDPAPQPQSTKWKGFSDFRLAQAQMAGEDISDRLQQRLELGANLVRVFGMKANNTGWDLIPSGRADYFGDVRRFLETAIQAGLAVEWTVFADTREIMPQTGDQLKFWEETCQTLEPYAEHVVVELVNEWNHPTQKIDPSKFMKPAGVRSSHGSGQTDQDPVWPRWDFACYHARRDGARGFTNYDPYEFQAVYPQPCPLIPDEGAKPENYAFDPVYAELMGRHAGVGWGGTFHSSQGVNSQLLPEAEARCARAFFNGIGG